MATLAVGTPTDDKGTAFVIGAGVVGVCTAYHLSRQGRKVVVLEGSDGVARSTSFRNGALICPSLTQPWVSSAQMIKFAKQNSKSVLNMIMGGERKEGPPAIKVTYRTHTHTHARSLLSSLGTPDDHLLFIDAP
jgi:monoamine oxidase